MGLHLAQLKFVRSQKQTIVQPKSFHRPSSPKTLCSLCSRLQSTLSLSPTPHSRKGGCDASGRCPMPRTRRTVKRQRDTPNLFLSPRQHCSSAAATSQSSCERWWPVHQIGAGPEKAAQRRCPTSLRLLQAAALRLRALAAGPWSPEVGDTAPHISSSSPTEGTTEGTTARRQSGHSTVQSGKLSCACTL